MTSKCHWSFYIVTSDNANDISTILQRNRNDIQISSKMTLFILLVDENLYGLTTIKFL